MEETKPPPQISKWVVCRICANNKDEKEMRTIFDDEKLLQDIRKFGRIKCIKSDFLPDKICHKCLLLLKAAKTFHTLGTDSEKIFQNLHNEIKGEENNIKCGGPEDPETLEDDLTQENIQKIEEVHSELDHVEFAEELEEDDLEDQSIQDANEVEVYTLTETISDNEDYDSRESHENAYGQQQNDELVDIEVLHENMESSSSENSQDLIVPKEEQSNRGEADGADVTKEVVQEEFLAISSIIKIELPEPESKSSKVKRPVRNSGRKKYKELSFICPVCGNFYTEKCKLTLHMKNHSKVKAHVCELCGKSFSQTPQLARHMNSHTGHRPYKCKYCDSSFADPSTCIKHQRIHTNERPYKCEVCDKAFAYSNVLKVHILTHTGEKPYACKYCGKRFTQLHHMKSHERTHQHPVDIIKLEEEKLPADENITGT